ncbi:WxL domain-containing protein [Erysipelothrix sp. HDW6B]|uniref:WxL domain-containing protein n=1 Tax=Erysipelothrix TaxID=1647 RepID=UPI00135809F3|nr:MULTISPECIES: WxL domain-containing protein [Erysipelothrix]QIK85326.1 WxL domain-containing protein [Erysipelothrix sp. HDW6B]
MKKKLLIPALVIALMVPTAVFADENNATTATSNVGVEFVAETPTEPVKPVDPTDPTKPLEPGDGGEGTGNIGPLTIDYVPQISFGEQKLTRKVTTMNSTTQKPFVQVTDVRGTGQGWNLQASLGEFTNGTHVLPNAKLVLENGAVKTGDTLDKNAPVTSNKIELTSSKDNNFVDIMNADTDHGMGTWITTWLAQDSKSNDKVTLNLDTRDARVGNYNATITWNLIQTP